MHKNIKLALLGTLGTLVLVSALNLKSLKLLYYLEIEADGWIHYDLIPALKDNQLCKNDNDIHNHLLPYRESGNSFHIRCGYPEYKKENEFVVPLIPGNVEDFVLQALNTIKTEEEIENLERSISSQ